MQWKHAMAERRATAADAVVARNIRVYRLAKGMSQSDLAAVLGVTFQQVQKYEKGANRVASGRLVRIAEVLEVPLMALLQGSGNAPGSSAESSLRLISDRRAFRLAETFAKIRDSKLRLSLVDLVERVARAQRDRRGKRT